MKLNLVVIRTENPKQLAEFYEQLGLTFEYHRHGKGVMHYSTEIDGLVFEIYPFLKNQTTPDTTLRLGFEVKDLEKLLETLSNHLEIIQPVKPSPWGKRAIIKDLDGRKIELTE